MPAIAWKIKVTTVHFGK